ncbi:CPBP family intramembrane glutamic endopeptidase [Microbulbifer aggregans]|uniref:CPBP family intramembrane glutamic endopeptidase n=1 Tax=Microbulbifer aggregans TaxID=1769779 RepID=UPI001CFE7566|nr:CPBP family intramembrane glutamic endopeptidase [Microbulbifer aggregans]
MQTLEIALLLTLLLFPIADLVFEKYKSQSKIVEYVKVSVVLWAITGFLIYSFFEEKLSVNAPYIFPASTWKSYLAISIFITFLIYLAYVVSSINSRENIRLQVANGFKNGGDSLLDIVPESRKELLLFTLLVSVSAGICEELIFRWYLYSFLDLQTHWVVAVFGSSVLFGLWHVYLGWRHVIKTAFVGALFCGIYLYFESIVVAIIAHILADVYSGTIAFFARNTSGYVPSKS